MSKCKPKIREVTETNSSANALNQIRSQDPQSIQALISLESELESKRIRYLNSWTEGIEQIQTRLQKIKSEVRNDFAMEIRDAQYYRANMFELEARISEMKQNIKNELVSRSSEGKCKYRVSYKRAIYFRLGYVCCWRRKGNWTRSCSWPREESTNGESRWISKCSSLWSTARTKSKLKRLKAIRWTSSGNSCKPPEAITADGKSKTICYSCAKEESTMASQSFSRQFTPYFQVKMFVAWGIST